MACLLLLGFACEAGLAARHPSTPANGSAPSANAPAAGPHKAQPHDAAAEPAQHPPAVDQTPPPEGRRQAVAKLLADSFKRLKGSARPPPPRSSPPADCSKHPGLCQPTDCEVWRPDIKDKCATAVSAFL